MIFGDTETTGLLKPEINDLEQQPYITELYLVKLNMNKDGEFEFVDEIETFFRPPHPLDPIITKITGITDAMLETAPTFASKYSELCDFFLGEDTFVAHNATFDVGMIFNELRRIECEKKFPFCRNLHCTVELSMPIEHKRLKLGYLHQLATGAPHEGAHRAKDDVMALVTCYKWLMDEGYIL